jgi:hypothetical protein
MGKWRQRSIILDLGTRWEISPSSPDGKSTTVPTGLEVGWTSEEQEKRKIFPCRESSQGYLYSRPSLYRLRIILKEFSLILILEEITISFGISFCVAECVWICKKVAALYGMGHCAAAAPAISSPLSELSSDFA